jgi:hypothetical protein
MMPLILLRYVQTFAQQFSSFLNFFVNFIRDSNIESINLKYFDLRIVSNVHSIKTFTVWPMSLDNLFCICICLLYNGISKNVFIWIQICFLQ